MTVFVVGAVCPDIDFLTNTIADVLAGDRFIIACDKGYLHLKATKIEPDVVIGDFDSAGADIIGQIPNTIKVIKLNPIKDDTDIEAALNYAFEHTTGDIVILGGLGGRIDHSLGNIALLGMGLAYNRKIYIQDLKNRLQMLKGQAEISFSKEGQYGKYISVFPYYGKVSGLSMNGFKYPLLDATIEGFNTLTVSNEIVAEAATISLKQGYLLVCECAD